MDNELYASLIRKAELRSIDLTGVSAERIWDEDEAPDSAIFSLAYNVGKAKMDNGIFRVEASFEVNGATKSADKDKDLFSLVFTFRLIYSLDDFEQTSSDMEMEEILKLFCERNVPLNIWPFARELASSMTVRMGFPAVIIGLRRLPAR